MTVTYNEFPYKLWIVINVDLCHFIKWNSDGTTMLLDVCKMKKYFSNELSIFECKKVPEFLKQLDDYQFHCLPKPPNKSKASSILQYMHAYFQGDHVDLLLLIRLRGDETKDVLQQHLTVAHQSSPRADNFPIYQARKQGVLNRDNEINAVQHTLNTQPDTKEAREKVNESAIESSAEVSALQCANDFDTVPPINILKLGSQGEIKIFTGDFLLVDGDGIENIVLNCLLEVRYGEGAKTLICVWMIQPDDHLNNEGGSGSDQNLMIPIFNEGQVTTKTSANNGDSSMNINGSIQKSPEVEEAVDISGELIEFISLFHLEMISPHDHLNNEVESGSDENSMIPVFNECQVPTTTPNNVDSSMNINGSIPKSLDVNEAVYISGELLDLEESMSLLDLE